MSPVYDIEALVLACAAATYVTRFGGHMILSRFGRIHHRVSAALDAVPVAVMAALVAPSLAIHGPPATLAIVIAGLAALRAPLIASVVVGMVTIVVLRAMLG
jgi:uncharacterized membrane protein